MCLRLLPALLALVCVSPAHGGKVLVIPMDGSHWIQLKVLVEELHSKGHSITVLRPADSWFIKESPNYTNIQIPGTSSSEKKMTDFAAKMTRMRLEPPSVWDFFTDFIELSNYLYQKHKRVVDVVGEMFENKAFMQALIEAKFDLVLTDPVVGTGILLARRLELPLVLVSRWTFVGDGHSVIAPSPLSYVPILKMHTDTITFLDRVKNVIKFYITCLHILNTADAAYKPFVHRYFGSDVHYNELFQAADIWLMRIDFAFEFPRPTMPNVVYIGGYSCKPPKPLPHDLEGFMQSSGEHGVIIMSLGTLVAQFSDRVNEEIAAAFANLPQKVIWRFKGKRPVSLGNNTLLLDWLPQSDILGHPKTKVFVAHGGTNGLQEAIYHGVPLVGIPLMYDQPENFARMEARGVAKVLDIVTLNRDNFLQALKEVLYDPSYREKIKTLSKVHRDTPMKPLDTSVFWVEFVMRHKGAKHLSTQSYQLSFFQYHSIDVILFLAVVTLLCVSFCVTVLKCLCRLICHREKLKEQ